MRKFLMVSAMVLVFAGLSAAQDTVPSFDLFGGYSYFNNDGGDVNGHGWEGAGTFHLNDWLGVTADFSGHYGGEEISLISSSVDNNTHTFLFGPTVSYRGPKVTPFAHFLLGGARTSSEITIFGVSTSASDTAFAMAFGGGVDWHAGQNWSIRLGQFDYLPTWFGDGTQNNIRLSAGLVYRWGGQ
jgi:opacity protein-like surface antigen